MRIRLLSQNNTNTLFICRYIGTRKNDLWNFRKWTMFQLRGMPLDTPPITNQSKSRSNRTCPKTPAWQDDFDQAYEKRNIKFAQCCSTNVFLWEPFLLQLIIYFFLSLVCPVQYSTWNSNEFQFTFHTSRKSFTQLFLHSFYAHPIT